MKTPETTRLCAAKTSIRAKLNVRKDTPSDHFTVVIQIIRHRRRSVIFTPYRLRASEFDNVRGLARTDLRSSSRRAYIAQINDYLRYHVGELHRLVSTLEASGKSFTASDVARQYRHRDDLRYVSTYLRSLIAGLRGQGKYGSAESFASTLSAFERFTDNRSLLLDDLDAHRVLAFRDYLQRSGLKPNTVSFYLSKLRAAYNRSVAEGHAPCGRRPFESVSVKTSKTWKLALSDTLLRKVCNAKLSGGQSRARDFFMFSFYCRGMSFVDMAYLRWDDICDGVMRYRRRKTGQLFTVRLVPEAEAILERYGPERGRYVFPILSEGLPASAENSSLPDERLLYEHYRRSRSRYLHLLRRLAQKLKLDARLSFNTARHTWASRARRKDISVSVISEGLGHTMERTTRIYLEEMEPRRVDDANRIVTAL